MDAPDTLTLPGTNHALSNYASESCGNGRVTLAYAFAESCNTPFAQLAMDVGVPVGLRLRPVGPAAGVPLRLPGQ